VLRDLRERLLRTRWPSPETGLFQPTHLIIILVIALIVLGPKRLPEAGRGLGEAIRGFRTSFEDQDDKPQVRDRGDRD
jgi:sec-independent protein translocase protein TatA